MLTGYKSLLKSRLPRVTLVWEYIGQPKRNEGEEEKKEQEVGLEFEKHQH